MQALEHPFLKRGGRGVEPVVVPVAKGVRKQAGVDAQQAAAVKESDRLKVDSGTVKDTLHAERWREALALVETVRAPLPRPLCCWSSSSWATLAECALGLRACCAWRAAETAPQRAGAVRRRRQPGQRRLGPVGAG